MKKPERTSLTIVCAPKEMASPKIPAPVDLSMRKDEIYFLIH